ncbi:ovarian cancer-associated gene 2 protein homolog [Mucor ambiguus]|uniref:Ovarian cancer-associated gene 2 protein homolog n=1 Tax=Mucor ambiguus TaxID=91626 RepID=A0A0C9LPX8_9FUNG|nr:ovarian cancer-associated gene 2 protein homolog [Mucor ambiguus]
MPLPLTNMTSSKLRILCLHGYTQNATMFRKKTAVARKSVEDLADFVYITGPHHISPPTYSTIAEREEAAKEESSEGFKESIEYVKDVLIKEGPFDGIMGFSQGGCFAALLTELLEDRTYFPDLISPTFEHPPFKFSIIVAGFKPTMQEATNIMLNKDKPVKTSSMHFIGDLDTLVLPEAMVSLSETFENPTIFRHAGGHYLPSNSSSRKELERFITRFMTNP